MQIINFQGFSEFSRNHDFCRKIKVIKRFPFDSGYPGHAYAPANDSPTPDRMGSLESIGNRFGDLYFWLPRVAWPCDLSEVRRPPEIIKYDAGGRHRRHRVHKQVSNVSSDVLATFCGDWRHLDAISRKFPKTTISTKKSV